MGKCIGCNQVAISCVLFKYKDDCPCNTCLVKVVCQNACIKLLTFSDSHMNQIQSLICRI